MGRICDLKISRLSLAGSSKENAESAGDTEGTEGIEQTSDLCDTFGRGGAKSPPAD